MDEFTQSTLSNAAGTLAAQVATWAWRIGAGRLALAPPVLADAVTVLDTDGTTYGRLSGEAALRFREAMTDKGLIDLARTWALTRFLESSESGPADQELKDALATRFAAVVRGHIMDAELDDVGVGVLWDQYAGHIDDLVDRLAGERIINGSERELLTRSKGKVSISGTHSLELPKFLCDMINAVGTIASLEHLTLVESQLRAATVGAYSSLRLGHALEDTTRPLAELYIDRRLTDSSGGSRGAEEFLVSGAVSRCVILGDPGNGKSTLTQYLLDTLSQDGSAPVPVILRLREISHERPIITDELCDSLKRELQLHDLNVDDVSALLSLGRLHVILDGLDELLGVPARTKVAGAVERFVARYPLTRLVLTSREVGYDQASLSRSLFAHFRLMPFSEGEIQEYVRRWFGESPQGIAKRRAFLEELGSVPDLRSNPLMLSLICTLHKVRGHIPRNRRQVYSQCADLLFNRWDPLREIPQPLDHEQHGKDLMEDIALWFFNSQAAQAGVEERQLEKVIANFFVDNAGVLKAQANARARDFLDYCAGRAWLLGYKGQNAYGERLFVFTHRTFMEFFAAEGLARTTDSSMQLAQKILQSYSENQSSVVPELIIQATEVARRGSSRQVLQSLKEAELSIGKKGSGRFLALRLRLAGVLTLNPVLLDEMLGEALSALTDERSDGSVDVFDALLRLERDPRARLQSILSNDGETGAVLAEDAAVTLRRGFLDHWFAASLLGKLPSDSAVWEEFVQALWSRCLAEWASSRFTTAMRVWAMAEDRHLLDLQAEDLRPSASVGAGDRVDSVFARTVGKVLGFQSLDSVDLAVLAAADEEFEKLRWTSYEASSIMHLVMTSTAAWRKEHRKLDQAGLKTFLLLLAVTFESTGERNFPAMQLSADVCGHDFLVLVNTRDPGRRGDKRATFLQNVSYIDGLAEVVGPWVRRWARGTSSFVVSSQQ